MDISDIVQTSLDEAFETGSVVSTSSQPINETIIIRSGDGDKITFPSITTNMSGSASIQLPSNATFNQTLTLPSNVNTSGGPFLCQLDDGSYILIDGLDSVTTTTTTTTTTSPTQSLKTSPLKSPISRVSKSTISPLAAALTSALATGGTIKSSRSTASPSVTKGGSPVKSAPVTFNVTPSTSQPSSRPFLILPSPPVTSKAKSVPTKDSTTSSSKILSINSQTPTSTHSSNNFIATSSAAGQNTSFKYIILPQSKTNSKIPTSAPVRVPISGSHNAGMKTITLCPVEGQSGTIQKLHLPAGTSLIPSNGKATSKPTIVNPHVTVIPPSKINLQVPTNKPTGKIQFSQVGSTKASEPSPTEDENITSGEIGQERTKSPTLFEETVDDIQEVYTKPTRSMITYSKASSVVSHSTAQPKKEIPNAPTLPFLANSLLSNTTRFTASTNSIPVNTATDANKNASSQPLKPALPLQFIIPNSIPKTSPASNRKRGGEMKSMLDNKKLRLATPSIPSIGEAGTDGKMIREVIAPRLLPGPDKAISSTAFSELKKLIARRELFLKQLNTSCKAFGKVDYKLSISGAPINVSEIYERITSFQQQLENDLVNLDWAISALSKLYSELAPKDDTRSTEDILKDLLGPTDQVADDPKAKYDALKPSSPKKPRARTPKKPTKTVFRQGEKDCPSLPLEERKVPDKPDPVDGKFHCELCPKVFLKQISLVKHLEFDHPPSLELEKKMTSPRSPKLAHACSDCDKSFHSGVMLSIHRSKDHGVDSYEISRTSVKRSASDSNIFSDDDIKSPSEDESKARRSTLTRGSKTSRKAKKPKRPTRVASTKAKPRPLDSLDFLYDSDATLTSSPQHNSRSDWREIDLFDPDIPIECTDDNPIIPLRALSKEVIDAYTYSSRNP